MTTPRFSKSAMVDYLARRIDRMERVYGFTTHSGWAQVDGKPADIQRAYGAFDMLQEILLAVETGEVTR